MWCGTLGILNLALGIVNPHLACHLDLYSINVSSVNE
jgi:hypothetical protein